MAALADEQRVLEGVTTERLCAAAGVTDRTYRRARVALLSSGELVLRGGAGGRGNTNCWEIADPRSRTAEVQPPSRRRVAPPSGQRPLLASVTAPPAVAQPASADIDQAQPVARANGGPDRTVSGQNRPVTAGVSRRKGGAGRTLSHQNRPASAGVSVLKAGADRTLSRETPAQTPAKPRQKPRRPTRARVGNPRTPEPLTPPAPLEGGASLTRSSSRRRTSPSAVAHVGDRSGSTSRPCGSDWRRRGQRSRLPGSRSAHGCCRRSVRARLRSGWRRLS